MEAVDAVAQDRRVVLSRRRQQPEPQGQEHRPVIWKNLRRPRRLAGIRKRTSGSKKRSGDWSGSGRSGFMPAETEIDHRRANSWL